MGKSTLMVDAELKNLAQIREFIMRFGRGQGGQHKPIMDLVTAVDEAATNAIIHGYRKRPGWLEVEVAQEGAALVVHLRDGAPVFDPTNAPPPDLTLPLEERPLGGLGIFMMKSSVDELTHRALPEGGNELTFRKETH